MAQAMGLKPAAHVHGSCQSGFAGLTRSLRALNLTSRPSQTRQPLTVEGKVLTSRASDHAFCSPLIASMLEVHRCAGTLCRYMPGQN